MNIAPASHQSSLWSNRTVGLLGGSFNPAHEGHRHISLYALKLLGLDAVWWMVSPQNPLKSTKDMATLKQRMASATEASRHPDIYVTDIERQMGTHYTVDTLAALKSHFPHTNFIWLMGTDNLLQIHHWQNWERILANKYAPIGEALERFRASLLSQEQGQLLKARKPPVWTILHIPLNDQSATNIREKRKLQS